MAGGRFIVRTMNTALRALAAANDQSPARVDGRVARAVAAMNGRLQETWTVARLARVAGMSRAAFARRFLQDLGLPPLRYLTEARLVHAARRLVTSDATLAEIAQEVGYTSAFALSRAFRRHAGKPPAVYRREARGAATVMARIAA